MKILIIGAGILGSSTAWHLAQRGIEVEIVDAGDVGKATLAGAGIVCPWASLVEDGDFYDLYAAGARYYATLIEDLARCGESDFGYGRVGGLVVVENTQDFEQAAERVARRTSNVPEAGQIEHLSSAQACEKFPPLREGLEAIFIPGAARIDGRRLSEAMLRASVRLGAKITHDKVSLYRQGNGVACRASDERRIEADEIIITAGVWAAELLKPLNIDHPVVPQKGQIIHLQMSTAKTSDWPVVLPVGSYYLLAFDDSRIVIGATREDNSGFDTRVTAGGVQEVLDAGLAIAPGLSAATHIETRVGLRPAVPNMMPILERVVGIDGLIIGNGLGAAGLTIGPFAGNLLANIALNFTKSWG